MKKYIRKPPAYLEYASDVLASKPFKLSNLAERGLYYTLKLECWIGESLTSDPYEMAILLNLPVEVIKKNPNSVIMSYFKIENGSLRCPELDNYRLDLEETRKKLSDGGQKGGKATQNNIRKNKITDVPNVEENPKPSREARLKPLSREEEKGREGKGGEGRRAI